MALSSCTIWPELFICGSTTQWCCFFVASQSRTPKKNKTYSFYSAVPSGSQTWQCRIPYKFGVSSENQLFLWFIFQQAMFDCPEDRRGFPHWEPWHNFSTLASSWANWSHIKLVNGRIWRRFLFKQHKKMKSIWIDTPTKKCFLESTKT